MARSGAKDTAAVRAAAAKRRRPLFVAASKEVARLLPSPGTGSDLHHHHHDQQQQRWRESEDEWIQPWLTEAVLNAVMVELSRPFALPEGLKADGAADGWVALALDAAAELPAAAGAAAGGGGSVAPAVPTCGCSSKGRCPACEAKRGAMAAVLRHHVLRASCAELDASLAQVLCLVVGADWWRPWQWWPCVPRQQLRARRPNHTGRFFGAPPVQMDAERELATDVAQKLEAELGTAARLLQRALKSKAAPDTVEVGQPSLPLQRGICRFLRASLVIRAEAGGGGVGSRDTCETLPRNTPKNRRGLSWQEARRSTRALGDRLEAARSKASALEFSERLLRGCRRRVMTIDPAGFAQELASLRRAQRLVYRVEPQRLLDR
jgi:hypothetical protein